MKSSQDAGGPAQEGRWRGEILKTSNTGYLQWTHRAWERKMLRRLGSEKMKDGQDSSEKGQRLCSFMLTGLRKDFAEKTNSVYIIRWKNSQ